MSPSIPDPRVASPKVAGPFIASPPAAPKRLLLIKFGAIGDCIMALPAARAAADRGFAVTWVCGQAAAPVLALYPWITLHVVDDRKLLRGSLGERCQALLKLWRLLGRGHWDTCATLYYDRRYRMLTLPVRARRKFLLSHTDRALALLPGRHHSDEYHRILLGLPDDVRPQQLAPVAPPVMPLPPALQAPGAEHGFDADRAAATIVLVPGGARNLMRDDALRRWPVELYVALARRLLERGHRVLLSGGPDDAWVSPHFAGLDVTDTVGSLTLPETLGMFEAADVIVTHDTGPLHLAGLAACGLIGIFGPTDPHGRLPHRPGAVALWGGVGFACRPCYDGRDYAPCSRNACVEQITPVAVLAEIDYLLQARATGRMPAPAIRTVGQPPPPSPFPIAP